MARRTRADLLTRCGGRCRPPHRRAQRVTVTVIDFLPRNPVLSVTISVRVRFPVVVNLCDHVEPVPTFVVPSFHTRPVIVPPVFLSTLLAELQVIVVPARTVVGPPITAVGGTLTVMVSAD